MAVIPFYGSDRPDLFAIERAAMDRPGRVIAELNRRLPGGRVLDVGAGDGFTAAALTTDVRSVVPLEPAFGMVDPARGLRWVRGEAEHLPFADATFDAGYATWAYFFSREWDPTPGLAGLHRVVRPGGPLLIVDNLGDDEVSALTDRDITADPTFWESHGFDTIEVLTSFEFANIDEARTLLGFYFGERGQREARVSLSYRVGIFVGTSAGG